MSSAGRANLLWRGHPFEDEWEIGQRQTAELVCGRLWVSNAVSKCDKTARVIARLPSSFSLPHPHSNYSDSRSCSRRSDSVRRTLGEFLVLVIPLCPPIVRRALHQRIRSPRGTVLHSHPGEMSAALHMCYPDPAAASSSSKARCSSPSPLSEASRVKCEMRTPLLNDYGAYSGYPDGELVAAADTYDASFVDRSLISSSSPSRLSRPPTLQPSTTHLNHHSAALFPHQYIQPTQHPRQDVLPLLNPSFPNDFPETAGQHGSSRPPTELPPPRAPVSQHVSINSSGWTSSHHPVFTSTSALAAHHGIPQSLPPPPRTTRYLSENQQAVQSSPNQPLEFDNLISNYLTMLAQKPTETQSAPPASAASDNAAALQAVLEVIQCTYPMPGMCRLDAYTAPAASPEFQEIQQFAFTDTMSGDYDSFLTSPMEESPYEEMIPTPALGSGDFDFLTSPAIVDADDFGFGPDTPLFGDAARFAAAIEPVKAAPPVPAVHHPVDFDGLYTMSPDTPALDPSSLQTSPLATPMTPSIDTPAPAPYPRRRNAPTGTRKNITPEALVPYDAPIQPRNYVTPSSTSRKAVPAAFAKKRARSQAFDDDELADDAPVDPNDLDAIEAKRRQNTLAARRSRKRKLEYQRQLEDNVERLSDEKEAWKRRAEALEAVLRSHGLEVPSTSF